MHPNSLLYLLSFLSLCYRSVIFVISLLSLLSSRRAKRLWASRPKLALSWSPNSTDLYFWYLFVDICQQTNTKDIAGQSASYLWDGELFWCMVIHYWWTDMLKVTHFQVKLDGEEPEQQSPTGGRCLENDWTNPVIFLYSSHLFLLPGCHHYLCSDRGHPEANWSDPSPQPWIRLHKVAWEDHIFVKKIIMIALIKDLDRDRPQEEQLACGGQLHAPLRLWKPSPLPRHWHK